MVGFGAFQDVLLFENIGSCQTGWAGLCCSNKQHLKSSGSSSISHSYYMVVVGQLGPASCQHLPGPRLMVQLFSAMLLLDLAESRGRWQVLKAEGQKSLVSCIDAYHRCCRCPRCEFMQVLYGIPDNLISESPGRLLGPSLRVSDLEDLGWGWGICISHKFPGDAHAARTGPTL